MKFNKTIDSETVEFEVEFKRLARCNALPAHAMFVLKVYGKEFEFCTHDFGEVNYQGQQVPVIQFYNSEFKNIFGVQKYDSVKFIIPQGVYDEILRTEKEKVIELENNLFSSPQLVLNFKQEINTYDTPLPISRWCLDDGFVYDCISDKKVSEEELFAALKNVGCLKEVKNIRLDCEVTDYKFVGSGEVLKNAIENILKRKEEEELRKKEEAKKEKEERMKAIEEEIDAMDLDLALSSRSLLALHSLSVNYSKSRNFVRIEGKTYNIREEVKRNGFKWNPERKCWETQYSDENLGKAVQLVRKYDKKTDPAAEGYVRCWECGRWFKPKKGDWDGFGWYCGC